MKNNQKPSLPKRVYYRLCEAAQELGCTEKDLLQMGVFGEIEIVCRISPKENFFLGVLYSVFDESDTINELKPKRKGIITPIFSGTDFVLCLPKVLFDIDMDGFSSIWHTTKIYDVVGGRWIVEETASGALEDEIEFSDDIKLEKNEVAKVDNNFGFRFLCTEMDSVEATLAINNRVYLQIEKNDLFVIAHEVERVIAGIELSKEQKESLQKDVEQDDIKSVRKKNTYIKIIKALIKELTDKHRVPESTIATIIEHNSDLLGEPVATSTIYEKLKELK